MMASIEKKLDLLFQIASRASLQAYGGRNSAYQVCVVCNAAIWDQHTHRDDCPILEYEELLKKEKQSKDYLAGRALDGETLRGTDFLYSKVFIPATAEHVMNYEVDGHIYTVKRGLERIKLEVDNVEVLSISLDKASHFFGLVMELMKMGSSKIAEW